MKICFIDSTNIRYSFKDINDPKIRGAESIFINLSKTLSENGNQIFIFSNCKDEYLSQSYSWTNISKIQIDEQYMGPGGKGGQIFQKFKLMSSTWGPEVRGDKYFKNSN